MKKSAEYVLFLSVLLLSIYLVIFVTIQLIELPDSNNKALAITLMIPIVGALFTGILVELFKFIFERNDRENSRKKEKIELLTKLAINLSTNMINTENGIRYIDIGKYSEDLNTFIAVIISEVDKLTVSTIQPLIDILLSKGRNSVDDYKKALGMILVNIRKSYGYEVDKKSEEIIVKAII